MMSNELIILSISVMGIISILVGLMLSFAAKKFKVYSDPRKDNIFSILPGTNCGACGFLGCEQYAEAIINSNVELTLCKPGGENVAKQIAYIMGKEDISVIRMVAVVLCNGGTKAKDEVIFSGIKSCDYVTKFIDSYKECKFGCLGFGDCVKVCPFDAIKINENNVAEVEPLKCTGCGLCVKSCPKNIIKLVPCNYHVHILCSSKDKGNIVRQICFFGCIACGLCVKTCPVRDIVLNENLAIMKYDKCNNCGLCIIKCPTKCISSKLEINVNKENSKIFSFTNLVK